MRRHLAVACTLAAALSGCGSSGDSASKFSGEEKAVAQVIEDLQVAGERKDASKICSEILAAELVDQLSRAGTKCADELEQSIKDADDNDLETISVDVRGTVATARVRGSEGDEDRFATFEFRKERGKWRATSLAAQ